MASHVFLARSFPVLSKASTSRSSQLLMVRLLHRCDTAWCDDLHSLQMNVPNLAHTVVKPNFWNFPQLGQIELDGSLASFRTLCSATVRLDMLGVARSS